MPKHDTPPSPAALSSLASKPSAQIRAVVFDAFGTLFDVHSITSLAERLYPGHGAALSTLWRDKQIEYTRLVAMGDMGADAHKSSTDAAGQKTETLHYRPFSQITLAALRYSCARLKLDLGAQAESEFMQAYFRLTAFPETKAVLRALQDLKFPIAILSNGEPALLAALVKNAGMDGIFDHLLSADSVQSYKTSASVYALGPAALGFDAEQILFVSSNGWDALGAGWFGYSTFWCNRAQWPSETLDAGQADYTGADLRALIPLLSAQPRAHPT